MVESQALTIGVLAKRMGLRTSAVRYYERHGILPGPQRLPNGYRVYDESALTYLRLLRQTQALGVPLKEARDLIRLLQRRQRPCERVHEMVTRRLGEVERTIRDLSLLRAKLRTLLKGTSPEQCPPTELCPN